MFSANISNKTRKAVYKRDNWCCALCDTSRYLQVHHYIPRGKGGKNTPHNLITLCSDCHALAHGTKLKDWVDMEQEDIEQAIVEYLADTYPGYWEPGRWEEGD